jgi:hypothetical protein
LPEKKSSIDGNQSARRIARQFRLDSAVWVRAEPASSAIWQFWVRSSRVRGAATKFDVVATTADYERLFDVAAERGNDGIVIS